MSKQPLLKAKKDRTLSIFALYVAVTLAVYILPYTKFVLPYIISALLMMGSLPFIVRRKAQWVNYAVMLACTGILIMFVLMLKELAFVNGINEFIRHVRFFTPVLWGCYAVKYCNKKQKKFILLCFGAITVFVFYKTLAALSEDVWIARLLAESASTSSAEINAFRLANVGGFEFSYMMGVVTISLVWLMFNARKMFFKIICLLLTVLCYYYIIQTMYTTLLILTTVCIILLVIFYVKNTFLKVLIVSVAVAVLFFLPDVSLGLSRLFSGSLLADKFAQIHSSLTGGGTESLGTRPERMLEAFIEFTKSPLWGGNNVAGAAHSLFFHTLANYGIIGIVSLLLPFVKGRKMIVGELKNKNHSTLLLDIVFLYIAVLAILNPIGYVFEVTIAAFFIVPIFIETTTDIIKRRNEVF